MQKTINRSYNCQKHVDQKVMFVCAVNDWHFDPLCQLCTPAHTQNHAKRLKINLESFDDINKKVVEKQTKVSQAYQTQVDNINEIVKKYNFDDFPIIKDLKEMQEKIITRIKNYFVQLNQKVAQKLKNLLNQNKEKVKSLSINLQNEIKCAKQISQPDIDLYTWKNSAKKIYFQEKLQSYLEESKQITQEFEQKCVQITSMKKKQLFSDENKFMMSLNALINAEVKTLIGENPMEGENKAKAVGNNVKKPGEKDLVKKPIVKLKSKQCKNCNQEMEYLTENKKHLICRFCNFKERNYIKKSI